jgi:ATP-dependent helicase/nuclease subunit B
MTLRLVLGRAGTGKTRLCLDEICAEMREEPLGPPLLFIVPAQASFSMERELASRGGGLRAQVYSFKRLAHRVLREAGGAALLPVSELGRRVMLKSILLEEKGNLGLMGALQNRPGFLASLSELVGELKMCRIFPEDLAEAAGEVEESRLGLKLRDFTLVYHRLRDKLAGRFTDPDDYLDLLARQLPAAAFLEGCRVWVDGFASFTPQECAVLKALLEKSREVAVTLCLDEAAARGRLPVHHPFVKPREACDRLRRLAREAGVEVREDFLAAGRNWRFAGAPELAHLEKHYFTYPTVACTAPVERIRLAAGVNVRAEVEGVALEIRRLLREKGLRPRQVMVAVRDVDVYFPLFQRALADYGIPFFIDHRRPVMHHPLVELLRSALEVWQSGWTYDPVFRYLKTGLTRVSREEVDRLENYVLAAGIRGGSWYGEQPWNYVPGRLWEDDEPAGELPPALDEINDIRRRAVRELRAAQLKAQQAAAGRPARLAGREWARILLELCLELDVPRRLDGWSRSALEKGLPGLAREHRQVWRLVSGLWDELVEVLGDQQLTASEFSAVLDAGLEAATLSLIPPGLDAVTVGSLDRSRPPGDVRALFIPGLTEGALPAGIRVHGVFTEREREELSRRLAGKNLELPPGARDRLRQEQFLIYRALTRTGGLLYLSYPLGDDEGRAVTPSAVVRRVRELFPGLEIKLMPADPPGGFGDAEFVEHPAGLLPRLALRWREAAWGRPVHPLWWRVYNLLVEREEWRDRLKLVVAGLTGRNVEPPLAGELGLKVWCRKERGRRVIAGSVSRLERFVNCPFAHFLAHGLGLEERAVYRLAPPDTGQLYHEALRLFAERVAAGGPGWEKLREDEVHDICAGLVEELAPRLQGRILLSSARLRRQKERLLERVSDSARALVRQVQGSGFRPAALEVYFGPRGKGPAPGTAAPGSLPFWPELNLPPLEIDLGNGVVLSLSGRIDRVDLGSDGDGLYLRIIDYKSGREKLELPRVLAGAQLQLLVYLWVALEYFAGICGRGGRGPDPAGAFYFHVQRPVMNVDRPDLSPADLDREWLKQFKLSGWVVDHGPELYRLLDRNLEPGSSSLLVPAALTKDGRVSGQSRASVYTPGEFRWLLGALGELLQMAGRDIARGRVDIAPLKMGRRSACDHCVYSPVCRFDPWLPENRHRSLNLDARELRRRVNQEAGREGRDRVVFYQLD